MDWFPASWRAFPAAQQPLYPDAAALARVEAALADQPPLVPFAEVAALTARVAKVAAGRGFLLQGGDCLEPFGAPPADAEATFALLGRMAGIIAAGATGPVVTVARAAGQYGKPRTAASETVAGTTLPAFRGDSVNGAAFDLVSRTPDPARLVRACAEARATLALLARAAPGPIAASHEALLLPYEEALTRRDPASGQWWASSAHTVWIGDRTRQLDGAHVEWARGIVNTIGLKCGPTLTPDALPRLAERLDPHNRPGRLVLIARLGAERAGALLAPLMRATAAAGLSAVWMCDPMHGNTVAAATSGGVRKTRFVRDVLAELDTFFDVADATGAHAGGIHLELTASDVTECVGGSARHRADDLGQRYLTGCDPRLNTEQALDVAHAVAARLARPGGSAVDAAADAA